MNSLILFKQLLVLLALMLTGLIAYKTKIIDDNAHSKISTLVVWVLNPFLMISGVIGKSGDITGTVIYQNLILVLLFYTSLFILGLIYIKIGAIKDNDAYLYRLVILFPNVGFMGIPLVKVMLGDEYILLVAFYALAFNVLCYTYGIHIAAKYGGKDVLFNLKKMVNPGTISSGIAILLFVLSPEIPAPIVSYVDYMGNTAITVSMIVIGISLAKLDWSKSFNSIKYYIFLLVDMICFPLILISASKLLPFDSAALGVFHIMACMPVASLTCMLTLEYSGNGSEAAKLVALTTIATVITAPLVIMIAG